jgi:hypothetical protein
VSKDEAETLKNGLKDVRSKAKNKVLSGAKQELNSSYKKAISDVQQKLELFDDLSANLEGMIRAHLKIASAG